MKQLFSEIERDFYLFMKQHGPDSNNSKSNYISWLRYINTNNPEFSTDINETKMEDILRNLDKGQGERIVYQRDADIANFRSALNKFRLFTKESDILSDEKDIKSEENEIENINNSNKSQTEKLSEILSRYGQGLFRTRILNMFKSKCLISGCSKTDLLIASHIKPWIKSDDIERLDENNGILLLPTYDKLFDKGYISFDSNGKIIISGLLTDSDIQVLKIPLTLSHEFNDKQLNYLEYHLDNIFIDRYEINFNQDSFNKNMN